MQKNSCGRPINHGLGPNNEQLSSTTMDAGSIAYNVSTICRTKAGLVWSSTEIEDETIIMQNTIIIIHWSFEMVLL